MKQAVIVSAVRTPVGKLGGALAGFRPERLGGMIMDECVARSGMDPELIDEVIFCNNVNSDVRQMSRNALLCSNLPIQIPTFDIHRGCASSLTAVWTAALMIKADFAKVILCGGVESSTLWPYLLNKQARPYSPVAPTFCKDVYSPEEKYGNLGNGETAEEIARRYHITREECDQFALESHRKAAAACRAGRFKEQLLPIQVKTKKGSFLFEQDETVRMELTMEDLAKLKPSFIKDGVCTAGNSSPLTDGASCVMVCERELAERLGLDIMAVVADFADVGCDPTVMGEGPIHAVRKLMAQTGLTLDDMDLIEMNEAFASQSIRCMRELHMDPEKLNVNGGAIALGHPFACTGTILVTKILYEMRRRNANRGLVTFCVGGGLGVACTFEKP